MMNIARKSLANENNVVFHKSTFEEAAKGDRMLTKIKANLVISSCVAHLINEESLFSSSSSILKINGILTFNLWVRFVVL